MALSDQVRRDDFDGNGLTLAFPYTFRILSKNDLLVLIDGVLQPLDTAYTVDNVGVSTGGNVLFVTAPADGTSITILGGLPFEQLSRYLQNEGFPSARVEKDFDKAIMLAQQMKESATRAISLPVTEPGTVAATTWPAAADRPNKFLGFDASGNPIATAGTHADAAAASADAAALSATASDVSAAASAASVVAAAASAAASAVSAATLQGTSVTSVFIGTGSKAFTTQAGKQFAAGEWLLITSDADPTNYLHGQVTSYSGTALVVNVTNAGGSGTLTDWTITLSGTRGSIGLTGLTGQAGNIPIAAAAGTVDAITANYSPDLTLTDQKMCAVICAGANTSTAPTFAPDGLTAYPITKKGGLPLLPGDLAGARFVALLVYMAGVTQWELLNPAARPRIKLSSFTYDISTASGTVAITGVGFTPRLVEFTSKLAAAAYGYASWNGVDDGTIASCLADTGATAGVAVIRQYTTDSIVLAGDTATPLTVAHITVLGADGFTLTWTKTGSPVGTATIFYKASE